MDTNTEFKVMKGFEDYVINKHGTVISLITNKEVKRNFTGRLGNPSVVLRNKTSKFVPCFIAKRVAEIFIPKPLNKNQCLVGYKDGDVKNVCSDNLEWITHAESEQRKWIRIFNNLEKEFPYPYHLGDGLYPNPFPSHIDGFYRLPFESVYYLLNKNGEIYSLRHKKIIKPYVNKKGYPVFNIKINGEQKILLIHRLVALMFVPVPIEHSHIDYDELQVNHIDAIKTNNKVKNLEWCTAKENMDHMHRLRLTSKPKVEVVRKNILTNEETVYESIIDCCRQNFIDKNMLYKHLYSISAGSIVRDNHVYKLNNGKPWIKYLASDSVNGDLWKSCGTVAKNIELNKTILFNSIVDACETLGLNQSLVTNTRNRKGYDYPINGWIFYPLGRNNFKTHRSIQ